MSWAVFVSALFIVFAGVRCVLVEYHAGDGNIPLIISAPHGGSEEPDEIPNRERGCYINGRCEWRHGCSTSSRCRATTVKDMYTKELALELRAEIHRVTGHMSAAVVNNLHRRKLDPNRERDQATFGVLLAASAFDQYMTYIDLAKCKLGSTRGLFLDIHGHGHPLQRAELGYLISKSTLNSGTIDADETSIRNLYTSQNRLSIDDLVRGPTSLGTFLQDEGYNAVPSSTNPRPLSASYFSGGELTRTEGSRDGGSIDAIQIESARSHRLASGRQAYVRALARAVVRFLRVHYGYN